MDPSTYPLIAQHQKDHWWFQGRQKIFLKAISPSLSGNLNILDVGCGTGSMGRMWKTFGTLTGVDINADALRYASHEGYDRVVQADASHMPFKNEEFDVVVVADIIEHVEDEHQFLKEIGRVLKKGGVLFVSTAAFQWLWSPFDELSHHYRRYSKQALIGMLGENGFTPSRVRYYNFILFPMIAIIRFVQNLWHRSIRKQEAVNELRTPVRAVNSIMYTLLSIERFFLCLPIPFGVSLLGIFKKITSKKSSYA